MMYYESMVKVRWGNNLGWAVAVAHGCQRLGLCKNRLFATSPQSGQNGEGSLTMIGLIFSRHQVAAAGKDSL